MNKSLQELLIVDEFNQPHYKQIDNSVASKCVEIEVIFRNQKEKLLELISDYPYVLGCVAWLTDFDILSEMSKMDHVSIIVQKEDFLRPDLNSSNRFTEKLRRAYSLLPTDFYRHSVDGLVSDLSMAGCPTIDPVRCMGNHNSDKNPSFPRMHNKFLVFTENIPIYDDVPSTFGYAAEDYSADGKLDLPKLLGVSDTACVWTGSYNISHTATKSLENAVVIRDQDIAQAYFNEWSQIMALSEPLDWESEWVAPEWRIGT